MGILPHPPWGISGFWHGFYRIAVNTKAFRCTAVYLQWSLKNSSTVNQREFMHSPDFVSSSQQTQFEYPRHQHSETPLCIHVGLSFTNTKESCFLCQSVRDARRCLYIWGSLFVETQRRPCPTGWLKKCLISSWLKALQLLSKNMFQSHFRSK